MSEWFEDFDEKMTQLQKQVGEIVEQQENKDDKHMGMFTDKNGDVKVGKIVAVQLQDLR